MARTVVVLIKGNPRESHKPAEAIRIALGLISGEHAVEIVLLDQTPLLLGEDAEDLADGELLLKYLPSLPELGQKFYVEETTWKELDIEATGFDVVPVSLKRIGEIIRNAEALVSI